MDPLAEIRAEYASLLPAYLAELRADLAAERWDSAVERAHRLAGTAGSYGFRAVGAAARAIELAVEAGVRGDELPARIAALDAAERDGHG